MIPSDVSQARPARHRSSPRGWTSALFLTGVLACAPTVKRDLSRVPVGQVGFDDLCGLQNYFDAIAVKNEMAPLVVDAADVERVSKARTIRGGRARFAFETDFQLTTVRRVLSENWSRLPENVDAAHRIDLDVNWSERSGLRRVVNNSDPELVLDGMRTSLPYHVCLSELLFGEPLYRQRRDMLGLAPQPTAHPLALGPNGAPDGGATDADSGGFHATEPAARTDAAISTPPTARKD